ncbi:MAG: hypothetical protein Q7J13_01080, partial [Brevundimonas sp.]|uniref:hypothetical protein n=1 Tax=Brevundimonas sp. TaxID=1871086 RepID=UPI002715FD23
MIHRLTAVLASLVLSACAYGAADLPAHAAPQRTVEIRGADARAEAAAVAADARPDRIPAAPDIPPLSDTPRPWSVEGAAIPAFPGA